MKYLLLVIPFLFIGCATKQIQQPKYYSIQEFIQEYMESQQIQEVEDEVIVD